jgi:hypothetical protein
MTTRFRRLVAVLAGAAAVSAAVLTGAADAHTTSLGKPTSTKTVVVTRYPDPVPLVLNLRLGRHATFDRAVVDLSGPLTGYRVGYVKKLTYDGSGAPVPLSGKAFLEIALSPADAHAFVGEHALNVYSGPRLTRPGMPTIKGVAFTGDFEAVVSFGLALDHKAGFRVFTLKNPNRLVIDVAH